MFLYILPWRNLGEALPLSGSDWLLGSRTSPLLSSSRHSSRHSVLHMLPPSMPVDERCCFKGIKRCNTELSSRYRIYLWLWTDFSNTGMYVWSEIMKRLKGVLDGLRPGSSAFQSSKDKSEQHSALDTAPDAPANAADIDTVQELLRPEHFKLAKVKLWPFTISPFANVPCIHIQGLITEKAPEARVFLLKFKRSPKMTKKNRASNTHLKFSTLHY